MQVCRVGYALNSKKLRQSSSMGDSKGVSGSPAGGAGKRVWRGGGLADILRSPHHGVTFEAFDYDDAVNRDQHFDVIIHKLTEDLESSEPESAHKIDALSRYLDRNPRTAIIDSFSAVKTVVSRARTTLRLQHLIETVPNCAFKQPQFAIAPSPEMIRSVIRESNLSYPVICKPIEACGTPNSHSMVVAVSEEGLSLVSCPCVIQEYIDHNGRFCKVYVMDKEVMVFQRPSLPNLTQTDSKRCAGCDGQLLTPETAPAATPAADSAPVLHSKSVAFDSRYKYPTVEDFYESNLHCESADVSAISDTAAALAPVDAATTPDEATTVGPHVIDTKTSDFEFNVVAGEEYSHLAEKFSNAAKVVSDGFSLSLFGFDVIIPANSTDEDASLEPADDLVIIDINFFPSYKEISDFPDKLCNFLRKRAGMDPVAN